MLQPIQFCLTYAAYILKWPRRHRGIDSASLKNESFENVIDIISTILTSVNLLRLRCTDCSFFTVEVRCVRIYPSSDWFPFILYSSACEILASSFSNRFDRCCFAGWWALLQYLQEKTHSFLALVCCFLSLVLHTLHTLCWVVGLVVI